MPKSMPTAQFVGQPRKIGGLQERRGEDQIRDAAGDGSERRLDGPYDLQIGPEGTFVENALQDDASPRIRFDGQNAAGGRVAHTGCSNDRSSKRRAGR